jgi:hypothetical protein
MDRSKLESLLGLDGKRCESVKETNLKSKAYSEPRCSKSMPKNNQQLIKSLVGSMINLTQASPDLESKLRELAQLVHCHFHRHWKYREVRIEIWAEIFPVDEDQTDAAVIIERKIKNALRLTSVECIGKKNNDNIRCYGTGGQQVQNYFRTIDQIIKPEVYQNDEHLSYFLSVLEVNMYCPRHMIKEPLRNFARWKSSITDIRKTGQPPNSGLCTKSSVQREEASLSSSPLPSADLSKDPSTFWPRAFDTSSFNRIETGTSLTAEEYENKIKSLMQKSLDQTKQEDGYIYLYEVEGNKGLVKLGYTTECVKKRYKKWTFDCNRKCIGLYPLPLTPAKLVPHAHHVEKLCHAELAHCRLSIECRACLKDHKEWFQTSPEEAISVIEKYSNWMIKKFPSQAQKAICDTESESEDGYEQTTQINDQSLDTAEIQEKLESMTMSEKISQSSKA